MEVPGIFPVFDSSSNSRRRELGIVSRIGDVTSSSSELQSRIMFALGLTVSEILTYSLTELGLGLIVSEILTTILAGDSDLISSRPNKRVSFSICGSPFV